MTENVIRDWLKRVKGSMIHSAFFLNQIYVAVMNTAENVPKELQSLLLTKNLKTNIAVIFYKD